MNPCASCIVHGFFFLCSVCMQCFDFIRWLFRGSANGRIIQLERRKTKNNWIFFFTLSNNWSIPPVQQNWLSKSNSFELRKKTHKFASSFAVDRGKFSIILDIHLLICLLNDFFFPALDQITLTSSSVKLWKISVNVFSVGNSANCKLSYDLQSYHCIPTHPHMKHIIIRHT